MKLVPLEDAVAGLTPALLLAYIEAQPESKTWVMSNGCACPIKEYLTKATGLKILTVGMDHVYKGNGSVAIPAQRWWLPEWARAFIKHAVIGEVWADVTGKPEDSEGGRFTYTRDQTAQLVKEFLDV